MSEHRTYRLDGPFARVRFGMDQPANFGAEIPTTWSDEAPRVPPDWHAIHAAVRLALHGAPEARIRIYDEHKVRNGLGLVVELRAPYQSSSPAWLRQQLPARELVRMTPEWLDVFAARFAAGWRGIA